MILLPVVAGGQEPEYSFNRLGARLTAGESVRVTDTEGRRTTGRVLAVEATQLVLEGEKGCRHLGQDEIVRVERRHRDSGVQGLVLGAAAGAFGLWGIAAIGDREMAHDPEAGPALVVLGAGGGALVGYIIDRIIPGRQTVYLRPRSRTPVALSVPAVKAHGKRLSLTFSF